MGNGGVGEVAKRRGSLGIGAKKREERRMERKVGKGSGWLGNGGER